MSLAPSYNLDVEIFKKNKHKLYVYMCVQKWQRWWPMRLEGAGGVQHAQQVHCVGGTAGGFHFQTKTEALLTESVNLFKTLLSTGLFTYTI